MHERVADRRDWIGRGVKNYRWIDTEQCVCVCVCVCVLCKCMCVYYVGVCVYYVGVCVYYVSICVLCKRVCTSLDCSRCAVTVHFIVCSGEVWLHHVNTSKASPSLGKPVQAAWWWWWWW